MPMSKILSVVIGASLSFSAAALFFLLYLRQKEENELEAQLANIYQQKSRTANQTTIRIKVPKNTLGAIIGRQGVNIKEIQASTKTKISFPNKDTEEHECVTIIRGHPDDVVEAEMLILKAVQEHMSIEIQEMFVPSEACGRIIGRNGENIHYMCNLSKAKINVDTQCRNENRLKRVTIKGTPEQIECARTLITAKVNDFERDLLKPTNQTPAREPRMLSIASPDDTDPYRPDSLQIEELKSTASDGFMEVYICSVDSPSQFWVQLVQGGRSIDLDKLVEEMTNYYSDENNREAHSLEDVQVGDIVAAPFRHDTSWYRARVEEVEEDSYNPQEKKLSLYYVDFGDVETWTLNEVCSLDKVCLRLPLQAVKCSLSSVRPVGGRWSSEAVQLFAKITHTANWKVIMLRVRELDGAGESIEKDVNVVDLIDSSGNTDVNVAEELVKAGYAEYIESEAEENEVNQT